MRAIPIPDHIAAHLGGDRTVIGEPGDPTRTDVRPCEYMVKPSTLYPGRSSYMALLEVDHNEREAIANGANVVLLLEGAEVPWAVLAYVPPDPPATPPAAGPQETDGA